MSLKRLAVGSAYSSFGEFKEDFEVYAVEKHIAIKVEKSDRQRYVACSATRANPDIGYSLVENDPLVTRFGFPWRWRDSVNGFLCGWLPLFPSLLSRLTLL
jgi:hypothetical protein